MVHPHITSSLVILAPALVSAPAFSPAPGRRIFPAPPALADAVSMLRSGGARKAISTCATARARARQQPHIARSAAVGRTRSGRCQPRDHAEPNAADARQAAARRVDRAGERRARAEWGICQRRALPTSGSSNLGVRNLTVARARARQARGDEEAGKVARTHAQRELEHALSQCAAARVIPSAVRTVRFLNDFLDDGGPLANFGGAEPLAPDAPIPTHAPGLSWFDILLEKLKHPTAAEIVTSLQRFVTSFLELNITEISRDDSEKAPAMLHAFLQRTEAQMREHVLWKNETPAQWEDTCEAVERFVFHKVYDHVFGVLEVEQDRAVEERIKSLAFLNCAHLDISIFASGEEQTVWEPAVEALRRINTHRCPAGKLDSIVQCSKIITRVLSAAHRDGAPPGADDFLPALILVLKQANPSRLHSNLAFIQYYRHSSKLVSEAGYIFTNLLSAVQFLETVSETSLTISVEDFHRGIAESREQAARRLKAQHEHAEQPVTSSAAEPASGRKSVHEIRRLRLGRGVAT